MILSRLCVNLFLSGLYLAASLKLLGPFFGQDLFALSLFLGGACLIGALCTAYLGTSESRLHLAPHRRRTLLLLPIPLWVALSLLLWYQILPVLRPGRSPAMLAWLFLIQQGILLLPFAYLLGLSALARQGRTDRAPGRILARWGILSFGSGTAAAFLLFRFVPAGALLASLAVGYGLFWGITTFSRQATKEDQRESAVPVSHPPSFLSFTAALVLSVGAYSLFRFLILLFGYTTTVTFAFWIALFCSIVISTSLRSPIRLLSLSSHKWFAVGVWVGLLILLLDYLPIVAFPKKAGGGVWIYGLTLLLTLSVTMLSIGGVTALFTRQLDRLSRAFQPSHLFGLGVGILLSSSVAIPVFGVKGTLGLLSLAALLLALIHSRPSLLAALPALSAAILVGIYLVFFPQLNPKALGRNLQASFAGKGFNEIKSYHEGRHHALMEGEWFDGSAFLLINGLLVPKGETLTDQLLGILPPILLASPRQVLFLDFANAAALHELRKDVIIESIDVLLPLDLSLPRGEGADEMSQDPRLSRIQRNPRMFLQTTQKRYDLIINQSSPLLSSYHSLDHYRLLRDHLAPRGLVAQNLRVEQLSLRTILKFLHTFAQAFPHSSYWRYDQGSFLLMGSLEPFSINYLRVIYSRLFPSALNDRLAELQVDDGYDLISGFLARGEELARPIKEARAIRDDGIFLPLPASKNAFLPYISDGFRAELPLDGVSFQRGNDLFIFPYFTHYRLAEGWSYQASLLEFFFRFDPFQSLDEPTERHIIKETRISSQRDGTIEVRVFSTGFLERLPALLLYFLGGEQITAGSGEINGHRAGWVFGTAAEEKVLAVGWHCDITDAVFIARYEQGRDAVVDRAEWQRMAKTVFDIVTCLHRRDGGIPPF